MSNEPQQIPSWKLPTSCKVFTCICMLSKTLLFVRYENQTLLVMLKNQGLSSSFVSIGDPYISHQSLQEEINLIFIKLPQSQITKRLLEEASGNL